MCVNPQPVKGRDDVYRSCGRCNDCVNMYLRQWTFRCTHELKNSPHGALFVTLSYNPAKLPYVQFEDQTGEVKALRTLVKKHYVDFMKRLRKALNGRRIKYIICGEYGSKFRRPHYHLLLFNCGILDISTIEKAWGMGQCHFGNVEPASIAYVFKYTVKKQFIPVHYSQTKPFIVMSKGIGSCYMYDEQGNIRPHFERLLKTYAKQPYIFTSQNKQTLKMSLPKFYLRKANYDMSILREVYSEVIERKFKLLTPSQLDEYHKRALAQSHYNYLNVLSAAKHTLSKDIF